MTSIKERLKKYKLIVGIYLLVKRHKQIPFSDYFNPRKIILFARVFPYTQLNYIRLSNNYELAKLANKKKIQGSFVECGVWKGGSAAVLSSVLGNRKLWLFDSFEGMPKTKLKHDQKILRKGDNLASEEEVKFLLTRLNLDKNIIIKKGWFNQILPRNKKNIGKIALLRIDADFYESTKSCLDNLYDQVVPNGYIILDDYFGFYGCRKAVDEFFKKRKSDIKIVKLDNDGGYFEKP